MFNYELYEYFFQWRFFPINFLCQTNSGLISSTKSGKGFEGLKGINLDLGLVLSINTLTNTNTICWCFSFLRLAEVMRHHSASSELVMITLPLPRRMEGGALVSPALYMAWLDILSCPAHLPPTLFIRGNQDPVLTLYSWSVLRLGWLKRIEYRSSQRHLFWSISLPELAWKIM